MNEFSTPIIALVGRPNVGKSTLFNLLTQSRDSLVADQPGVTRDRQFGVGRRGDCPYWVVDTGGLLREEEAIDCLVDKQARLAILESDVVFLLVDAAAGLQVIDEEIIADLRRSGKPFYLLANKIDKVDANLAMAEFYALGLNKVFAVSAVHKKGVNALLQDALAEFIPAYQAQQTALADELASQSADGLVDGETLPRNHRLNLTVLGRPNAGKSTLINRFLGEERVIASEIAGTTRDSISIPFEYEGQEYTLVDTAGVRRKSKVNEHIEKISVIKTLQALDKANVVLLMLDAHEGIADLDAHLLGLIIESGKSLVIAVNKWDHLEDYDKFLRQSELDRKLAFVNYARIHFISALHGTGIRDVLKSVKEAYAAAFKPLSTNQLTGTLQELMHKHQPPLVRGYGAKVRYAHQGGRNPPIIVMHGARLSSLSKDYLRYLEKGLREAYQLFGTPLKFQLIDNENPFLKN